jgi:hypothetical protein
LLRYPWSCWCSEYVVQWLKRKQNY